MTISNEEFRTAVEVLEGMTKLHVQTDERLNKLEELSVRTADLLTKVTEMTFEIRREIKEMQRGFQEMERENRQTRRIWIAIARKQELFDDDEFRDVFGDDES